MKRCIDVLISFILLIPMAPLFLVISLLIKFDSKGPTIFKQTRIGMHGKPFLIYKLRTMVIDSDKIGSHSTSNNDKRITRIGRFIRKTSIDELPQILNVLLGNMSLVGPRPDVPQQIVEYTPEQWKKRHKVRPGITGLAQATIRSDGTMEERTRLDLLYVDRVSVCFDLKIILMTVKQVLTKGGN